MVNQICKQPQVVVQQQKTKKSTTGRQAGTALGAAAGALAASEFACKNLSSLSFWYDDFINPLRLEDRLHPDKKLRGALFDDCVKFFEKNRKIAIPLYLTIGLGMGFGAGAIFDGIVNARRNRKSQKLEAQNSTSQVLDKTV